MRVVVTGGTGLIGSRLVSHLVRAAADVVEGLFGMPTRVSDAALESEVGFRRRFASLQWGIEAEAAAMVGAA